LARSKIGLKPSDFVHLHNHTQYSLLDGLTKIPALMKSVEANGMKAVAMTDHGTMSGAIEFYKTANEYGLKPIVGMEAYMASRSLTDKTPSKDKAYHHLILLAMDQAGYQNLMALSTIANLEGFYYKPRIDKELLSKHNEGLICLSGCASGELGDALRQGQYEKAKQIASWYKEAFKDRYYLEIQDHGHPDHPSRWDVQTEINKQLMQLSEELDIKCVVTCDAHYLNHEDKEAHEILLCVQTGSFLSDDKRMSLKEFDLHVNNPKEVIGRWGNDHPDFISNTREVADRCNLTIELGKILIPKFPVPNGETEKSYLDKLVYTGLASRYGSDKSGNKFSEAVANTLNVEEAKRSLPKEVIERAKYELSIIDQMKFNGYFLIIADFFNWGKNQGIVFGPGRGSAAGSIISYGLKITELDPLKYDLLFERFLNPDRISMPDVDIDIQDSRRDEVIQYCIQKYGKERVANIVTFGRMAARNAVRDVSRVLQVPYSEADRLAKMIPPPIQGRHIPLATSLKKDRDLKHEYENNETAKTVFDLALQMEGTIRSHGVHAAGVVIAPEDIVYYTPLELAQKGVVATQYSMGPIEELGLLKMDFLGLSNLTIINNALRIIDKVYSNKIDINDIPLDDSKTFDLFKKGDTTGVFQFESAGMKRYLKELKPSVFDDLIAMNALYRPGPMQWIDDFIARKQGKKAIEYLHPKTQEALQNTYGVLVYQEQVMQIAKDLCGFSGGQADTLRKGVAKKKPEVLAALKKDFINGALSNSDITTSKIEEFWSSLEAFAAYCFPKAHAACYATIAYQTAYLKAHYPAAFMAALMSSDYDDTDRLAIEIAECQHMGITVMPPDVNESFVEFAVVPDTGSIRFGMAAIKNVGTGAVEEILRARAEGVFISLENFLTRVSVRTVNRKAMESLIKTGAFDRFGDRGLLLHNLDMMLAYGGRVQKQAKAGQTDLFGSSEEVIIDQPKLFLQTPPESQNERERLTWERELLGLYLSQHPLEQFEAILDERTVPLNTIKLEHDGKPAKIGGAITNIREITTKNGQRMAFVGIADRYGVIEAVVFPKNYEHSSELWQRDRVVYVKGKISTKDRSGSPTGDIKIIVDEGSEITAAEAKNFKSTAKKPKLTTPKESAAKSLTERVYIKLASTSDQTTLLSLKEAIDAHKGQTEVVLVLGADKTKQAIKLPGGIDTANGSLSSLQELVGSENVVLR
jgi:DNA polymerase-3 subunit alpha